MGDFTLNDPLAAAQKDVTAAQFNAMVQNATLKPAAITGKGTLSAWPGTLTLLVYDSASGLLKKASLSDLVLANAALINGQTAMTAPAKADGLLIWDVDGSAIKKVDLSVLITGLTEQLATSDADHFIMWDASASELRKTPAKSVRGNYILLEDQKLAGTDGGTFTSGAWQTRHIAEQVDADSLCSVSTNQITLSAGTYACRIRCPAHSVGHHKARLYNTTGTAVLLLGSVADTSSSNGNQTDSWISGQFTVASAQVLEIQHRCETTTATRGFGEGHDFDSENDVYTQAEIWRIG